MPTGYKVAPSPEAEQLLYKHDRGLELLDRLVLFNWKAVGWCVGTIKAVNTDGRKKIKVSGTLLVSNFFIFYQHDETDAQHCLRLEEYGVGHPCDFGRWVLLEQVASP